MNPSSETAYYFAYDSTVSPQGLRALKSIGNATPVAVARLESFHWYINMLGQPNIFPLPQPSDGYEERRGSKPLNWAILPRAPPAIRFDPISGAPANEVWGTVYSLPSSELRMLNRDMGYNPNAAGARKVYGVPEQAHVRPNEQGRRNKRNRLKLRVRVERTIRGPQLSSYVNARGLQVC